MIKNASIKTAIKIKPSNKSTIQIISDKQLKIIDKVDPVNGNAHKQIKINTIYDGNNPTHGTLFKDCGVQEIINKFMKGFNITIMAYGQTGSGKTFALEGDTENQGIIQSTIRYIYSNLHKKSQSANQSQQLEVIQQEQSKKTSIIKCSYLQIYNEKVYDMIYDSFLEKPLKVKWQTDKEFIIDEIQEITCADMQNLISEWKRGAKNRIVAQNKINDLSSRSHSIFTITLQDEDENGNFRSRKAMFVDLAGSERIFSPIGRLTKEAIQINKSLFFLRKVITILQQINLSGKQIYIPYRDSKLTSLLKKALGGNCYTLMIACIDPSIEFLEENKQTINYIVSAGHIKNYVNVNIDYKARQILFYKQQNQKLKKQLNIVTKQLEYFQKQSEQKQKIQNQNNQNVARMMECISNVRELLKSNKQLREQLQIQRKLRTSKQNQLKNIMQLNKKEKYMTKLQSCLEEQDEYNQKQKSKIQLIYSPQTKKGKLFKLNKFQMMKTRNDAISRYQNGSESPIRIRKQRATQRIQILSMNSPPKSDLSYQKRRQRSEIGESVDLNRLKKRNSIIRRKKFNFQTQNSADFEFKN